MFFILLILFVMCAYSEVHIIWICFQEQESMFDYIILSAFLIAHSWVLGWLIMILFNNIILLSIWGNLLCKM